MVMEKNSNHNTTPLFSIVIPVYNREDELRELLESLLLQKGSDGNSLSHLFEVIVIDDGSENDCKRIIPLFPSLNIHYFYKENGGPASARNFGVKRASGEWIIFFDSDCIIPSDYIFNTFNTLNELSSNQVSSNNSIDLFGGHDCSHPSFTPLQKGIDYSMTSIITTGGIRGNKRSAKTFYPRTFNMGIRKGVFDEIGGFAQMRFGEDVDFSYRVKESGYRSEYFENSWVYHKRRNNFRTFFKQVFNSGIARIHLSIKHRGSLKIVHLLPTAFLIGSIILLIGAIFISSWVASPLLLLSLIIYLDALRRYKEIKAPFMAVGASFTQLYGYGLGLIVGWWNIVILKKRGYAAFVKNFYN